MNFREFPLEEISKKKTLLADKKNNKKKRLQEKKFAQKLLRPEDLLKSKLRKPKTKC
jgi:hypothetical protein